MLFQPLPPFEGLLFGAAGDAAFVVGRPGFEHRIIDARQFVRGGGDGFGRPDAPAHSPEVSAQRAFGRVQALRREAEDLRRAAGHVPRFAAEDGAAADAVVGTQAQPARKVPHAGELFQRGADLADEPVRAQRAEAGSKACKSWVMAP